jgi:SAM-dependent methyltransferase
MPHTLEGPASTRDTDTDPKSSVELDIFPPDSTAEAPPSAAPSRGDYRAFGNVESRNGLQARVEIPLLVRALQLPLGGRVLEVGCGRGVALPVLAERLAPSELTGIDVDAALVDAARERVRRNGTRAALEVGDVRALPFASGSFDLVIDFGTCYHVAGGLTGRITALNEIARVLRVGGLLVHETRIAQQLAHPIRSFRRRLPWRAITMLVPERSALLWTARRRIGPALV